MADFYTRHLADKSNRRATGRFFTKLLEAPHPIDAFLAAQQDICTPVLSSEQQPTPAMQTQEPHCDQSLITEEILHIQKEALQLKRHLHEAVSHFKALNEQIRHSAAPLANIEDCENVVADETQEPELTGSQLLAKALIPVTLRSLAENNQVEQPRSLYSSFAATDSCACSTCSIL